jgi:hypothetical protein
LNNQFLGVAYDTLTNVTKTQFYVTDLDSGSLAFVFANTVDQINVAQAASSPRWTRTLKMHLMTSPRTNTTANIELRNS